MASPRFSLGTKLALATVLVLAIVSLLLYVQLTGRERRSLVDSKHKAASMVADLFAVSLAAPLDFDDAEAIDKELDDLRTNPEIVCARVWTAKGDKPSVERGTCGSSAAPVDAELGTEKIFDDRVEVLRRVTSASKAPIGKTLLVFSLARENQAFSDSRRSIFWLSFALAAVTAALLIFMARNLIVLPLRALGAATSRIGRGDFTTRVEVGADDEIGELAKAFDVMREAVADREHRLAAATQNLRDLFDHMRQAILAFGADGKVAGAVSRQAARIFGKGELEGKSVRDLLYGGADAHDVDAQAFDEWLAMAFDVELSDWKELAALAPREVPLRRADGTIVPLELEFRAVASHGGKSGKIERVMLLATDVSEKRQLEQTVQTQEEEHARRMTAMRRLIAGGGQVFVAFIDASRERFARCGAIVGTTPRQLPTAEIDELFRHVHTVKGEARAFDLHELETECAKLEEDLDELRSLARGDGFATTGSVHGALTSSFARARAALDKGCDVFVAASPIGRAALDQITVQRSDVERLEDLARGKGDDLARVVDRLASRPFGESTASLVDMAPTWGDKDGKRVRFEVEGREVRVPPRLARVLPGVLTHLVRNAIAHGIETPKVREESGKPPIGVIRAEAADADGRVAILFEDDGRGLDMDRIEERAAELGVDANEQWTDRSELVFAPGLSTTSSTGALSGRGVGLGAVRADVELAGYRVEVKSKPGKYTRVRLYPA